MDGREQHFIDLEKQKERKAEDLERALQRIVDDEKAAQEQERRDYIEKATRDAAAKYDEIHKSRNRDSLQRMADELPRKERTAD